MNYPATRRARTDADGRFSITGIAPRMSYFSALPRNVDVLFPSDLEAKIAKAIKEKDIVAIHTSGLQRWTWTILNLTLKFYLLTSEV